MVFDFNARSATPEDKAKYGDQTHFVAERCECGMTDVPIIKNIDKSLFLVDHMKPGTDIIHKGRNVKVTQVSPSY